ncbi:MAG: VOC family protein [Candidatus Acidiferrales bacterium]
MNRNAVSEASRTTLGIEGVCPLLQVYDMPKAVNFYRDVLGFDVVEQSPIVRSPEGEYFHWAMLRQNGTTIMLNTAYDEGQRPPQPDAPRMAAHRDTSLYFGCPDVDAIYGRMVRLRVHVAEKPANMRYGLRALTIQDPDGYNITFHGPLKPR